MSKHDSRFHWWASDPSFSRLAFNSISQLRKARTRRTASDGVFDSENDCRNTVSIRAIRLMLATFREG